MYTIVIFTLILGIISKAWGSAVPVEYETRIIGGEVASDGFAPYQASLRLSTSHFCGGSVIGDRWVLTAAHCAIYGTSTKVVLGTNNQSSGGDNYSVAKIIPHPDYNPSLIKNDVALVLLNTSIRFHAKVQPIQLADHNTESGSRLVVTGWGTTSYPGSVPEQLQALNVTAVSVIVCKFWYLGVNEVWSSEICAFARHGQGACHGDSGGPLVEEDQLVGVVSWAMPCAVGYPDVYSRVYSFRDWIEATIDENS